MRRRTLLILTIAAIVACRDDTTGPTIEPSSAVTSADSSAEGQLHVISGDPQPGQGPAFRVYHLVDDRGRGMRLDLSEDQLAPFGGARALDRKRVRVRGQPSGRERMRVRSLEVDRTAAEAPAPAVSGALPYVTIACKFADVPDEPQTIETYRQWTGGTTYPGLVHYWRESSFGQLDMAGSRVVGWYTLPQKREYYVPGGYENLLAMMTDCTAAADADVHFPDYAGVNLQFNGWMYASYGGQARMWLDGEEKIYGMTWMAGWAEFDVYAHEEGHTFGLPHSSGSGEYDSRWDVMSNSRAFRDVALRTYIPTHTIAWHKSRLGWLRNDQVYVAAPQSRQSIRLERLVQPGTGRLLALIPLSGTDQTVQYSVEARRQVGRYEGHVPGNAVVIHEVDERRLISAKVVDADGNTDPNDAGAQWTVGETFTDAARGISVKVDSMTATGFGVTITRGGLGSWTALAPSPPSRSFAVGTAGDRVYMIGGLANGLAQRSVHFYDPAVDRWTGTNVMPAARYDGDGSATIGGIIYVPGGRSGSGALTNTLFAYDAGAGTWSTRAAMPIAGGCGGSGAIGGALYVLTGCNATGGWTAQLHRYTPATNSWTARAAAPAAHGFPAVGVINGRLYVAGGRNAAGAVSAALDVYDPATNSWTRKSAMPARRFGAGSRVLGGKLYVIGGSDGSAVTATTFVYDPATDRWSTLARMPTARTMLGVGAVEGYLYAVGGQAGTATLTATERLSP